MTLIIRYIYTSLVTSFSFNKNGCNENYYKLNYYVCFILPEKGYYFLLWIDFPITAILVCYTLSVMLQFSHFHDNNELHNVNIVITLS